MKKLRLGTRGSALARAQSAQIARRIEEANPGLETEFVFIKTSGDAFSLARPDAPVKPSSPNVKAMFVKEIEEALLRGEIDYAVHSSKDLPGELPEGLVLAAFPEREDPRDAFIPGTSASWAAVPEGGTIATASLRRQVQLRRARAGLSFTAVRGNVDTRLRKLKEHGWAGLVLAAAGLRRLGLDEVPREPLPPELVLPAPGQGALALEARADRAEVLAALSRVAHERTRLEVELERAFLAAVGGGCSTPLGALASVGDGGARRLRAFWSRDDGSDAVRLEGTCGPTSADARELALRLRAKLPA